MIERFCKKMIVTDIKLVLSIEARWYCLTDFHKRQDFLLPSPIAYGAID
jgi:hypothetical protein